MIIVDTPIAETMDPYSNTINTSSMPSSETFLLSQGLNLAPGTKHYCFEIAATTKIVLMTVVLRVSGQITTTFKENVTTTGHTGPIYTFNNSDRRSLITSEVEFQEISVLPTGTVLSNVEILERERSLYLYRLDVTKKYSLTFVVPSPVFINLEVKTVEYELPDLAEYKNA